MKKKVSITRYTLMSSALLIIGLIFLIQFINLQIINGKELDELSQKKLLNERDIIPSRGSIVDRDGVPMAVNRMGFIIQIVKTDIKVNELNELILKTIQVFEKNEDSYDNSLQKYLKYGPFEFGSEISQNKNALKKWKEDMVSKKSDINLLASPEDVFDYLRNQKFKIDKKYSDDEAYKIMTIRYEMLIRGFSSLNPLCIAHDVKKDTVVEIEERHKEFPGVSSDIQPLRKYIDGQFFAHVMGFVGNISDTEHKNLKDKGYRLNDTIGKSGIELQVEEYLRGTAGKKRVEVDTNGRLTEEIKETPTVPGNDVVLTLDMRLQKTAMESLQRNIESIKQNADYKSNYGDAFAGAAVALDVNNGEVLAMASYPSYDPSVYLVGSENKEAEKIKQNLSKDNENAPLLNRALQGIYTPGSTYKPITAIAGLEEGIIAPLSVIHDSGTTVIGGQKFTCLEYRMGLGAHGDLILERALATSCNIYFHELGFMTGIDNIDKWAKLFGLGEYTGIDLPGEKKGIRANKQTKKSLRNDMWRPADTAQVGIGQFDNSFTPLQIANYVGTIANGGKRYKPHIIKKIIKYDGSTVMETKSEFNKIDLKPETIDAVKKGMVAVTNATDGTAVQTFKDFPFKIAGKTGTPETGKEATHSSNALFVCYAPADDPKIAIAVVIERGAWGSNAAPIARDILKEYFGINNENVAENSLSSDEIIYTR